MPKRTLAHQSPPHVQSFDGLNMPMLLVRCSYFLWTILPVVAYPPPRLGASAVTLSLGAVLFGGALDVGSEPHSLLQLILSVLVPFPSITQTSFLSPF